jgi:hypothetical protein
MAEYDGEFLLLVQENKSNLNEFDQFKSWEQQLQQYCEVENSFYKKAEALGNKCVTVQDVMKQSDQR